MKDFDDINLNILLQNNSPIDEFLGMSPNQIHNLFYNTFGENSPLKLRSDITDETLDQIPFFRMAEEYLKIIQRDEYIKLTPLGSLPKKVITEVYEKRFVLEEFIERGIIKLWREEDLTAIPTARIVAEVGGLVRKANGKLMLTRKTTKLLESNDRLELFKQFFKTFTNKFAWSFNDGYPNEPIAQLGWGFSIILLDKFGDQQRKADFYAEKYLKAFPHFITFFEPDYATVERQFYDCYSVRTFDRFCVWFGLVTMEEKEPFNRSLDEIKRTELLKKIFVVEE